MEAGVRRLASVMRTAASWFWRICLKGRGDALRIVLGISSGPAPDRFLVWAWPRWGLLAHATERQAADVCHR